MKCPPVHTDESMVKVISSNYSIWKLRMKDLLFYKVLYDTIEGDSIKLNEKPKKEW